MTRIKEIFIMLCAFSIVSGADARLPPSSSRISEKVKGSEVILIAQASGSISSDLPFPLRDGVTQLTVLRTIKGKTTPDIQFVTKGFASEVNSNCCVLGKRYLLFLNRGYAVMSLHDGELTVSLKEPEKYLSGADGPTSAYQLCDNFVIGWPNPTNTKAPLNVVVREIEAEIGATKQKN